MSENGWIKLHRQFLQWEWYDEANTMRVFLHCLLSANHKEKAWRGIIIKEGSFITSLDKLAKRLKLSTQNIRTSLSKLKSTNNLTIKSTNKYTEISINNWNKYQQLNEQSNKQLTNNQQTTNNKQECKEYKEDIYAEFVKEFNQITNSKFEAIEANRKNFDYWAKIYSFKEMVMGVKLAHKLDDWWKGKLTPTKFLRQRNANGVCDNIGDLLNKYEGKYELN